MQVTLRGDRVESLRANVLRTRQLAVSRLGEVEEASRSLGVTFKSSKNDLRPLPRELIRLCDDGTVTGPNARTIGATCFLGFGEDSVDLFFGLFERFSPEGEDVGERTSDAVGFVGGTTEGDGDLAIGPGRRRACQQQSWS